MGRGTQSWNAELLHLKDKRFARTLLSKWDHDHSDKFSNERWTMLTQKTGYFIAVMSQVLVRHDKHTRVFSDFFTWNIHSSSYRSGSQSFCCQSLGRQLQHSHLVSALQLAEKAVGMWGIRCVEQEEAMNLSNSVASTGSNTIATGQNGIFFWQCTDETGLQILSCSRRLCPDSVWFQFDWQESGKKCLVGFTWLFQLTLGCEFRCMTFELGLIGRPKERSARRGSWNNQTGPLSMASWMCLLTKMPSKLKTFRCFRFSFGTCMVTAWKHFVRFRFPLLTKEQVFLWFLVAKSATYIVSMCLSVMCDAERPFPPPIRKFAGRSRSDLKKISILLGFLDLENFWLMGPPLVLDFKNFGSWGTPTVSI